MLCQEETEQDRMVRAVEPAEEWGLAEKVRRKEPEQAVARVEERVPAVVVVNEAGSVVEFKFEVI